MDRKFLDCPIKLGKDNFVSWYEQFENIALQYGEAGKAWICEEPLELIRPSPDDEIYQVLPEEYKLKVYILDYETYKKETKDLKRQNQALCGALMASLSEDMNVKVR
jgi:hypothetical protein